MGPPLVMIFWRRERECLGLVEEGENREGKGQRSESREEGRRGQGD